MTDIYTLYLVNRSASTQQFWCFLAAPQQLADDPGVFASSSACLTVEPNDPATSSFEVPVRYVLGAGASYEAVGMDVVIESTVMQNAGPGTAWQANYATVPPMTGPELVETSTAGPTNSIVLNSNAFNQAVNEENGWFGNMSYGIMTGDGFMGMSWSPSPEQSRMITPELEFYVTTAPFQSNALARWSEVTANCASASVPPSFQTGQCTIVYDENGQYQVLPGAPSRFGAAQVSGAEVAGGPATMPAMREDGGPR